MPVVTPSPIPSSRNRFAEPPTLISAFAEPLSDQRISASIANALTELQTKEFSVLCMKGGTLGFHFETRKATLQPIESAETHPNIEVVAAPSPLGPAILSISMPLPPFPHAGALALERQGLSAKGWNSLFKWMRQKYLESIPLWVFHLREIEEGALKELNARARSPKSA
ncbi:hypothetical protein ACG02S_16455 [Roseateles sp. DC23W]|uniref:Uncharacterized protein n=1 Tax=Pelomonas dachongensis TaxID=3299029 RepID=A0ABW7EQ69_9BURK